MIVVTTAPPGVKVTEAALLVGLMKLIGNVSSGYGGILKRKFVSSSAASGGEGSKSALYHTPKLPPAAASKTV